LDDLQVRERSAPDDYNLLMLASLLRKLILDGSTSLAIVINRTYQRKLRFEMDTFWFQKGWERNPLARGLIYSSIKDGIDPATPVVGRERKILELTLDQFLARPVVMAHREMFSVKDLILYAANTRGGVHRGEPKEARERAMADASQRFRLNTEESALLLLRPITRIVLRSLAPIEEAARNHGHTGLSSEADTP